MNGIEFKGFLKRLGDRIYGAILSVPVNIKISGIVLLPVLVLGFSLNYWITTGLSDWLSYLLTDVRVEAAMRAGSRSVVLVTILAAAGSIILASALTFILTRPLLTLREMAQKVADGDLGARAVVWSNDEIGDVAMAVNTMTDHLVAAQGKLSATNRRLMAINRIIMAADRKADVHDVLYAVLETVLDLMDLETGWIYLRDPERDLYHLASWYGVPSELEDSLLHSPTNSLCQCQADFVAGLLKPGINLCQCYRLECCPDLIGQSRHITIPLEAQNQRLGVMNLLYKPKHLLSEADLDLLAAIGIQVSEIVANAWLRLKLAEKEMARQALLESLVEAQEEERSRLARELHDGAGQMLTSLLVRLKTLEKKATSTEIHQGIDATLEVVSETIEQVRDLSYRLRPVALEEFGLSVALEMLVRETATEAGLKMACDLDPAGLPVPAGMDVTLYRIAQEAITNILRHARATEIAVNLSHTATEIALDIIDDGQGFIPHFVSNSADKRHLGLISMQERAAIIGGSLEIDSAPGHGTAIRVRVPLVTPVTETP